MYVWRMEKIMAENFREWKMLQQYEKYQKGRQAVQPRKRTCVSAAVPILKRDET